MKFHQAIVRLAALVALALTVSVSAQEHEHHDHGASVPDMDADGKRLESYQVKHSMDQETLDALRSKIALYRGLSDMQLNMNMSAMGPNYEWYASDLEQTGPIGVLILSHGVGENSDRMLIEAFTPVSSRWPTAVGFGMAMMQSSHLQSAADDLVERGAETIIVVPNGTTTEYNSLSRQWKYIFDIEGGEATYLEVPKVQSDARFIMTGNFEDSPLITEILYDHVKEVSQNPENEVVILVGHGPEDIEDNVPDLEILSVHMERIQAKNEFVDVKIINLQDDAIAPIRESNVRKLRKWVKKADAQGHDVIVVAIAAASHGVQTHIKTDLKGLNYTFAEKGMAEHPNYVEWLASVIEASIAENQLAAAQ